MARNKVSIFIVLVAMFMGIAHVAEAKTVISAQELYEQCKADINTAGFNRSKCSFYMQGFAQAHAMNIILIAECAKSVDYFAEYIQKAYCINPAAMKPEDFSKKFIDWYENYYKKSRFQNDAYTLLTEMMAYPRYCEDNTVNED